MLSYSRLVYQQRQQLSIGRGLGILVFCLAASSATTGIAKESTQENACHHTETRFQCVQYVRNYDGDTVTVTIPGVHPLLGHNISVRVAGIDTAELRTKDSCEKKMAEKAKTYVEALLKSAARIDLVDVQRDKYFRVLADIEVNGSSLAKSLLQQNLAVPYDGGRKQKVDWCAMDTKPRLAH